MVFAGGPCSVLQGKRKPEEYNGHQAQEGGELLFPPMNAFTACRDIIKERGCHPPFFQPVVITIASGFLLGMG